MQLPQLNPDDWETRVSSTPNHPLGMFYHKEKDVLLLAKETENWDGEYIKVTFKSTADHPDHSHVKLFESPILDTEEEAQALIDAIGVQPMRYARKFFSL